MAFTCLVALNSIHPLVVRISYLVSRVSYLVLSVCQVSRAARKRCRALGTWFLVLGTDRITHFTLHAHQIHPSALHAPPVILAKAAGSRFRLFFRQPGFEIVQ